MNVFITGIAGTLGSTLTRLFLSKGYRVRGNDIARIDDAWKLGKYKTEIEYLWKSTLDLNVKDLDNSDIIIDCGLEFADRPLGISSPTHTLIGNLLPPLRLLELLRSMDVKPTIIYPSSFNTLYGHPSDTNYKETTPVNPSSQYGWSKASAELLYQTYVSAHDLPVIITRVGSAYGPRARSDELIMKLIIRCSNDQPFTMRSPYASRLWTYAEDVISFYDKLIENSEKFIGETLHCAGNVGDRIVTNMELAGIVSKVVGKEWVSLEEGPYEAGEFVKGSPVGFTIDSSYTRDVLRWSPIFTIEQGLEKTIAWYNSQKTSTKKS